MNKVLHIILIAVMALSSCSGAREGFTSEELALINEADSIMRVLTVEDEKDLEVLRAKSSDLPSDVLTGEDYKKLTALMLATVTHPSQDGVGIAAPQVGINRRIVAVQRFDKEGNPFEVYPNISIVWKSDSLEAGAEGCLSVPNRRGEVMRSREIVIEYASGEGYKEMVRDTVKDFTAVIFQHEVDHLEGMLYIDRLEK